MSLTCDSITWEAVATFAVGLMAVGSAMVVGHKQATIADHQNEILRRQGSLQELSIKVALFEQRFAAYEATRKFLAEILQHDDEPSQNTRSQFEKAKKESAFLFEPRVRDILQAIWAAEGRLNAHLSLIKRADLQNEPISETLLDQKKRERDLLDARLSSLAEDFGDDLKLRQP